MSSSCRIRGDLGKSQTCGHWQQERTTGRWRCMGPNSYTCRHKTRDVVDVKPVRKPPELPALMQSLPGLSAKDRLADAEKVIKYLQLRLQVVGAKLQGWAQDIDDQSLTPWMSGMPSTMRTHAELNRVMGSLPQDSILMLSELIRGAGTGLMFKVQYGVHDHPVDVYVQEVDGTHVVIGTPEGGMHRVPITEFKSVEEVA